MKDYHINIFYRDEDEGYIAGIPDVEACSAFGETPDQALKEVEIARAAWLAAAGSTGKPIPQPRYRLRFIKLQLRIKLVSGIIRYE